MEKLLEILSSFQHEDWFHDIRVMEETHDKCAMYDEFVVELIVYDNFSLKNLIDVVTELKEESFNVETFFNYEKRNIKNTISVTFEVWRR